MGQMRNEIIQCLEVENEMRELLVQIDENEPRKESMVRIMAFIPCIMHIETRSKGFPVHKMGGYIPQNMLNAQQQSSMKKYIFLSFRISLTKQILVV